MAKKQAIKRPELKLQFAPPVGWRARGRGSRFGDGPFPMGDEPFPMGDEPFPMGCYSGPFPMGNPGTLVVGLGYHCDVPDVRDFSTARIKTELAASHERAISRSFLFGSAGKALKEMESESFDLRNLHGEFKEWPVENQGSLQSCTANAVIGMVEFLIEKGEGERLDLSRLFLYKATRRLLMWTGDTGAYIRTTIRALTLFGAPPEAYWPYEIRNFEAEPDAFLFSYGSRFRALRYARLDDYGQPGSKTLQETKKALRDGFPVAFGFPVYSSLATNSPDIPLPDPKRDALRGGHAVLAVGYDDQRPVAGGKAGALLIRNSWGPLWGDEGYGYLPYAYVENQWAVDFWTVYEQSWLNESDFTVSAKRKDE